MKVRNFEHPITDNWTFLNIPPYMQGLQLENPEGNDTVEYRWGGTNGKIRSIPAGAYVDFKAISKDDPIRNEVEVKGTNGQTLQGEYWVDNDQET